jgi:hypothetical protein
MDVRYSGYCGADLGEKRAQYYTNSGTDLAIEDAMRMIFAEGGVEIVTGEQ